MSYDLGQMMDTIVGYDNACKKYNFNKDGTGNLPWSHRFTGDDMFVEITGNKWIMYTADGEFVDSGKSPDELELSFKLIYG